MSAKTENKKERRKYFRLPIVAKTDRCPICNGNFVTSKLLFILYDALNEKGYERVHKVSYCNNCHLPFATEGEARTIETASPGLHVERIRNVSRMSEQTLTKQVGTPPMPIRNMPKGEIIWIGSIKSHVCGTNNLESFQGLFHGNKDMPVTIYACTKCGKKLMEPFDAHKAMAACPDYLYIGDTYSWQDIFPDKKQLYMLNINQYTKDTCPACMGKLVDKKMLFKRDELPKLKAKIIKQCSSCQASFGRHTLFEDKPYSLYKFSHEWFQEEDFRTGKIQVLKSGDFLTRHNLSGCQSLGHSLEDIVARVRIAAEDGAVSDYDAPAVRCDTCGRLFILESEYQKMIKRGAPLCPIVENEYWRTAADAAKQWSESDAKGSIIYQNGYNVNAQSDLSFAQRKRILESLIQDETCTRAEITAHLDTLIKRGEKVPSLKAALVKWRSDRDYISKLEPDSDTYEAESITRTTYHTKPKGD